MPRSRWFVVHLVGLASFASCGSARADVLPVLAGRIARVVAVGDGVAVLREGEALLLDAAGRTVGRCTGESAAAGLAPRADGTTIPAERLLRESGFREDDDSPEAEALLDDEGIETRRRRRPSGAAAGMPRAIALAAAPGAAASAATLAWIATADGLWKLNARTGSCARAGLGGHALDLVAAAAGSVVAVADMTVWRSVDGGASFAVAAVLTARAHALALAADGSTAFVATDDTVVAVTAARTPRPTLERRADAVVACGTSVVALAEDGVYRLDADGRAERLGDRPPARALACLAPTGPRLLAVGVGAWSAIDGGTWQEDPRWLGRSLADVAFADGRTWLAVDEGPDAGLVVDDPTSASQERPALAALQPMARPAGVAPRVPPTWAWLLPRVSISFDRWTESRARGGWRLWLVLTVSLDRRGHGASLTGSRETSEGLQ